MVRKIYSGFPVGCDPIQCWGRYSQGRSTLRGMRRRTLFRKWGNWVSLICPCHLFLLLAFSSHPFFRDFSFSSLASFHFLIMYLPFSRSCFFTLSFYFSSILFSWHFLLIYLAIFFIFLDCYLSFLFFLLSVLYLTGNCCFSKILFLVILHA